MGDVEKRIEQAYRASVAELPYPSISVVLLCKRAGVSRKMFYKCFKGKDDVLRSIFERDVVAPQAELCRIFTLEKMASFAPNMERHIFELVHRDGDFYRDVVRAAHGGEAAFVGAAAQSFAAFNRVVLDEYGYRGSDTERDYIASYFAEAKAHMLAKWVGEDYPLTPEEASGLYSRMALPFWEGMFA